MNALSQLVAQGFDRNRNGRVNDDLRIEAKGLDADANGQVSVAELASALAADKVVISNGAVRAGQSARARELPEIKSLTAINRLASDALGFFGTGNPQYPGLQYQSTYEDKEGNLRTRYNFGQAIADLRVRLSAISSLASSYDDFQSQTVARMANQSLAQNNMDYLLDNGTAQSRYAALYSTIQNIAQMSVAPAHPSATEARLEGSVVAAAGAVDKLRGALAAPEVKSADARASAHVKSLNQQIAAIPTWQKFLLVGLFKKGSLEGQIRDVNAQLQVLKSANPGLRQDELAENAARMYELLQSGAQASSIDAARQYENQAAPIINRSAAISNSAGSDAASIRTLIGTLNKR
ncbi:MAG: hypothetical protein VKP72_04675 [bacterium]|nr:hypothetical protein [bacterium]